MSTLRVYGTSLTAQQQLKLRVHKASLSAAVPTVTKLRVHKVSATAVAGVVVTVPSSLTAGPGQALTVTATLETGGSATWQWRKISGPAVGLNNGANQVSFAVPSVWNADTSQPLTGDPGPVVLVLGVSATVDGVTSPEVRCEITILPQLSWTRGNTSWIGAGVAPA